MNTITEFIKELDDEAYYKRCEEAIQNAIAKGKTNVFINLDWWKQGMKVFGTHPMSSYLLFNPMDGILAKRADAVFNRCEKHFKNENVLLSFGGCDGGSLCQIVQKK